MLSHFTLYCGLICCLEYLCCLTMVKSVILVINSACFDFFSALQLFVAITLQISTLTKSLYLYFYCLNLSQYCDDVVVEFLSNGKLGISDICINTKTEVQNLAQKQNQLHTSCQYFTSIYTWVVKVNYIELNKGVKLIIYWWVVPNKSLHCFQDSENFTTITETNSLQSWFSWCVSSFQFLSCGTMVGS